jgi:hypothetical protein
MIKSNDVPHTVLVLLLKKRCSDFDVSVVVDDFFAAFLPRPNFYTAPIAIFGALLPSSYLHHPAIIPAANEVAHHKHHDVLSAFSVGHVQLLQLFSSITATWPFLIPMTPALGQHRPIENPQVVQLIQHNMGKIVVVVG